MGKRGPKKGNGGRSTKLKVDDRVIEQLEVMAGLGLTLDQIGKVLGISEPSVKNYKKRHPVLDKAYKKGQAAGAMRATHRLRNLMESPNERIALTAIIFYLKTKCRWRETTHHELSGSGDPIQITGFEIIKPKE